MRISLAALLTIVPAALAAEIYVPAAEALAAAVDKPVPERPPLARQMRLRGTVAAQVRISEKGNVEEVRIVQGNALLASGVTRTLKAWKFKPFESGGKPVVALTTLRFSFKP